MPDGTIAYTRDGSFHLNAAGRHRHLRTVISLILAITVPATRTAPGSTIFRGRHRVGRHRRPAGRAAARHDQHRDVRQRTRPACWPPAATCSRRRPSVSGDAAHGRALARTRAARLAAGLRRGLERQRRGRNGQHDHRAARITDMNLARDQGRGRDAVASQQSGAVNADTDPSHRHGRDRVAALLAAKGTGGRARRRRRATGIGRTRCAASQAVLERRAMKLRMGPGAEVLPTRAQFTPVLGRASSRQALRSIRRRRRGRRTRRNHDLHRRA